MLVLYNASIPSHCIAQVKRIIKIWDERGVFRRDFIETLFKELGTRPVVKRKKPKVSKTSVLQNQLHFIFGCFVQNKE